MKKWQYKLIVGTCEEVEKEVNKLALDEWEPVGFSAHDDGLACMLKKRRTGYSNANAAQGPWTRAA